MDQQIRVTAPQPTILIANPGTPATARDPVNVTGVGQMVVDAGGGVGLCTGSLINPRTVIFAAHCVNRRAVEDYGANSGGQAIAWGFETYTRANAPGEVDELAVWLNGDANGAGKYQTNVAQAFYNSNYVSYNPLSQEPNSNFFLYADVATSSLDTPAANVPTWALLFSQLPAVPITADGTGYHVTITGYGRNGTGTTGSQPVDFRRRVAENTLGALASLDEFENFIYGGNYSNNPQNLYWIDFDDPLRGTVQASVFDFNAWRDNAQPNEGMVSSGDSGGPLILDRTFAKSVVIGVLSGGYPQFYFGQPVFGYGTAAFYQPLYLYWDWVAANNFYHYVGAKAGNGDWNDPDHWVTNLDPAYQVIVNGQLVNGIPTVPGAGNTEQPGFGQVCDQSAGTSTCIDIASGALIREDKPIGTADLRQMQLVGESATNFAAGATGAGQGAQALAALPAATLENGLPGASGFVPTNYDGDRIARVKPRYFDVTLGAAGTTTLGSSAVIDRFSVTNGGAMLDIQKGGSLTSLISVTQGTGTVQVNGALTTPGDYYMLTGGLNGTGVITAPFFTSTAGTISPGATGNAGTIGTLTFRGNTIFASGTTYMVDLGGNGQSDRIVVQTGAAGGGIANVGGRLVFSFTPGAQPMDGVTYRILTAENGVTGAFTAPSISAIITPELSYLAGAVDLKFTFGDYADLVDPASAVQTSFAAMMDANRAGSYATLSSLYGSLDMASAGGIRSFFESAAPGSETLRTATGVAAVETMDRFLRQRVQAIRPGEGSGQFAVNGNPLASTDSHARAAAPLDGALGFVDESAQPLRQLADDASGYLVAGYLDGSSQPMPGAGTMGRDSFDGWFAAFGLEKAVSERATVGFALSYADVDGTTSLAGQQAGARLVQGSLYGAMATDKGLRMDLRISASLLRSDSKRSVTLATIPYDLTIVDDALVFSAEGGIGIELAKGSPFSIVPRVSLRYETIGLGRAVEAGGPMALEVHRQAHQALEGRLGVNLSGQMGKVRPYLSASYVHDFLDQPVTFGAGFVGGTAVAPFALAGSDDDWAEISGGLSFELGSRAALAVEADTTVLRSDLRSQSYRGKLTLGF
ncbi:autotransporter domain-containing protein [Novosphingobium sp.]|uniref:autotransporter domain-containing protein n=1 Tax=Novosphingobium sp. TaxID=1874826 RepID=UPI0035AF4A42